MKIVLAEEQNGQNAPEQSFEQQKILIGRDANNCDIVFDNKKFPMVSRLHAELIWENDAWFLIDKSSYGILH